MNLNLIVFMIFMNTIRHTFGGQVRVVHGYPICTTNIVDPVTIRALVEIEAWLDTVDLHRSHSLPETSKYFKDNILASPMDQSESNSFAAASISLRMPASLFTKEKTAFVGLGWSNIVTTLPPQSKEEEKAFLSTLLQELNREYALQLDISPKVDRQLHTPEVSSSRTIIVGGGSHASRLATSIGSIYPEVVDLTIGGWRLTEKSGKNLAYDIENVLDEADPANTTIILHMFDNSVFLGESGGTTAAPVKVNGRYHILGRLVVANGKQIKELFDAAMPIFRAARGAELLIIGPLPRYLVNLCCGDSSHITNFTEAEYGAQLCAGVKEVGIHLRSLIHTRRIKSAKILNP